MNDKELAALLEIGIQLTRIADILDHMVIEGLLCRMFQQATIEVKHELQTLSLSLSRF